MKREDEKNAKNVLHKIVKPYIRKSTGCMVRYKTSITRKIFAWETVAYLVNLFFAF